MKWRILSVLALAAPLLGACGGGGGGDGPVTEVRLCPASLDYGTVFTGGGGDGELVKLQLDTAHYFQAGGDPAAAIRKYKRELLFLHLKDVTPATNRYGYRFVELGQGKLDFPAVIAAIKEVNFQGWAVIELDGPTPGRTPKESAAISKEYLEKLGVQV